MSPLKGLSFYVPFALFCLGFLQNSSAQCADVAEISTNQKCAFLSWNVAPGAIPNQIKIDGLNYDLVTSTSTSATYETTQGNGCNNIRNYTGDVNINSDICSYNNGVLVGSQSLPVELSYFDVHELDGEIQLEWTTASEMNNLGFDVEYAIDGSNWKAIGWVNGMGSTDQTSTYRFVLRIINQGRNYFRLKQVDFDGTITYSEIVSIDVQSEKEPRLTISPNPASDIINLDWDNQELMVPIVLYDQLGVTVAILNEGQTSINISHLKSGVYYARTMLAGRQIVERLVIR